MKNIQTYFFLFILLFSCGEVADKTEDQKKNNPKRVHRSKETHFKMINALKDSIEIMNARLGRSERQLDQKQIISLQTKISVAKNEYVDQNLSYFEAFPSDTLAPLCLVNLNRFYDENQIYHKAIDFIDTLELYYPKFKLLSDYIELKAVTLDNDLKPRDTARIRETYEYLLSLPDIPTHRKENYLSRLSNLDKAPIAQKGD